MSSNKKIFFLSDFHLGVPSWEESLIREKHLVKFLEENIPQMEELFLMGDIFDFWFEYKHAIPKGYVRILGCLAKIADLGIPIHIYAGNHDMWLFDYLEKEIGLDIRKEPGIEIRKGKTLYLGHGDGLGPGDYGYKFIKKVFANPFCQWLFARIHPNFGISLANYWSKKSRKKTGNTDEIFLGEDKEWLIVYSKEQLKKNEIDFFIFGHRHLPLDFPLNATSRYINLGDWIGYFSYAELSNSGLELKYYPI
jgi:UDP-2,3-diacylglucosamine hydrolase